MTDKYYLKIIFEFQYILYIYIDRLYDVYTFLFFFNEYNIELIISFCLYDF